MRPHLPWIEVALIDFDFIFKLGDIRNINAHGAILERLHKFVVLQAAVFRFVGVAHDNLIDVRLSKLLGFDFVLLAGPK